MELLTKAIRSKLPPLYTSELVEDPLVVAKFFTPWTNWTWYAIEFDGKDTFFGYVVGHEPEMGYFCLSELESVKGPLGLRIERDESFKPKPLSQVKAYHSR
jgi:hypothetical protein